MAIPTITVAVQGTSRPCKWPSGATRISLRDNALCLVQPPPTSSQLFNLGLQHNHIVYPTTLIPPDSVKASHLSHWSFDPQLLAIPLHSHTPHVKMVLKRKRSTSELCSSPSASSTCSSAFSFNSPPTSTTQAPIFWDSSNVSRNLFAAPAHLNSRTMKRFRDGRPSEEMVHRELFLGCFG